MILIFLNINMFFTIPFILYPLSRIIISVVKCDLVKGGERIDEGDWEVATGTVMIIEALQFLTSELEDNIGDCETVKVLAIESKGELIILILVVA